MAKSHLKIFFSDSKNTEQTNSDFFSLRWRTSSCISCVYQKIKESQVSTIYSNSIITPSQTRGQSREQLYPAHANKLPPIFDLKLLLIATGYLIVTL